MSTSTLDLESLLGGSVSKQEEKKVNKGNRGPRTSPEGGEKARPEEAEEKSPSIYIKQPGIGPCPFSQPATFDPGPTPLHRTHHLPHKETDQDDLIPPKGFVRDFCYSMYGCESPTIFNIWAGLFTIAITGARKAWFKWAIGGALWPNLYYIVVAPPGVCHKGAALRQADRTVEMLQELLADDPVMKDEKSIMSISSKASADAVFLALQMQQKTYAIESGGFHHVNFGSRAYVLAEELGTFLNTKKFNSGLIDTLTDLYDCKEKDKELTRMRGDERYEKIFFNLAGACTPRHLKNTLPVEAWEGGFMSRCVLVHQHAPTNSFYMPTHYDGYPTTRDLATKLGWIAYHARGEYVLSEDAEKFYSTWYASFVEMIYKQRHREQVYDKSRLPQLILRVATLIRMSYYEPGFTIEMEHLGAAVKLLEYTFGYSRRITDDVNSTEFTRRYNIVRRFIKSKDKVTRRVLLVACSGGTRRIPARDMSEAINQLKQEGLINIALNGHDKNNASDSGAEVYTWVATPEIEARIVDREAFIKQLEGAVASAEEDEDES